MAELREREDAVLQLPVWATGSNTWGAPEYNVKEARINGPGLQGTNTTLPSRDATRGMDPLFFDDLRLGIILHPGGDLTVPHRQLASAYQYYEATYYLRIFRTPPPSRSCPPQDYYS